MAGLITPIIWTRQPQYPVDIDGSNSIANGLVFAWNAAAPNFDSVAGRIATTNNTTKALAKIGQTADFSTGQTNIEWASYQPITTSNGSGTGDFTVMVFCNPQASGGGAAEHVFAQKNDAAGGSFQQVVLYVHAGAGGTYSSGSLCLFTYSGGTQSIAVSGGFDGDWHNFCGIRSGTTLELFKDGVSLTSATKTAVAITAATPRYLAIGSRGNGTTESARDNAGYAFAWNRALTKAEINNVYQNPWQLFQPLPRRIWIPGAVASGSSKTPFHLFNMGL